MLLFFGVPLRRVAVVNRRGEAPAEPAPEAETPREQLAAEIAELGAEEEPEAPGAPEAQPPLLLPFARRDLERLRLLLLAQRRLREADGPLAARQSIASKSYFEDAVRWLEIHGGPDEEHASARRAGSRSAPSHQQCGHLARNDQDDRELLRDEKCEFYRS